MTKEDNYDHIPDGLIFAMNTRVTHKGQVFIGWAVRQKGGKYALYSEAVQPSANAKSMLDKQS